MNTPADPLREALTERVWKCKIGAKVGELPKGADWPLRSAVMDAFKALTGYECEFIFSGWGAEVSPLERAVINDDDDAAMDVLATKPAPATDLWHELEGVIQNMRAGDTIPEVSIATLQRVQAALAAKPAETAEPPPGVNAEAWKRLGITNFSSLAYIRNDEELRLYVQACIEEASRGR